MHYFKRVLTWPMLDFWCCFYAGGMHRSWNVCFEGKEGACDTGGFWDGCGQGDEKGDREKHVIAEVVEMICISCLWCSSLSCADEQKTHLRVLSVYSHTDFHLVFVDQVMYQIMILSSLVLVCLQSAVYIYRLFYLRD